MKKIIRYMQDQARQQADHRYSGASYLTPPGKEPQQHSSQRQHQSGYRSLHLSHAQSRSSFPSSHSHSSPYHTSGTGGPNPIPRDIVRVQYAQDNIWQSYNVYVPTQTPDVSRLHISDQQSGGRYWVIYVHGGYFGDPKVTASSFDAALSLLASNCSSNSARYNDIRQHIIGYASINYRLSPNYDGPAQDPNKVPAYELRNAKWPEHFKDVLLAIQHLQHKYKFGQNYLLVGHSVGATMALLTLLNNDDSHQLGVDIEKPIAVLGLNGIYSFPLIHESFPNYKDMLTKIAIPNEEDWGKSASPAMSSLEEYESSWLFDNKIEHEKNNDRQESKSTPTRREQKHRVFLAHSPQDKLVDFKQTHLMANVFRTQQRQQQQQPINQDPQTTTTNTTSNNQQQEDEYDRRVSRADTLLPTEESADGYLQLLTESRDPGEDIWTTVIEISGEHNDIWKRGHGLANVIAFAIRELLGDEHELELELERARNGEEDRNRNRDREGEGDQEGEAQVQAQAQA